VKRNKHPNKDIERAIQYALISGWRYKAIGGSAHAWGRLLCPLQTREGCSLSVWSTPKDTVRHARQIRRRVDSCGHGNTGDLR